MLLRSGAERTLNSVDVANREPSYFTSVRLRVKEASSDLLSCETIVDRTLGDVFETALEVDYDKRVWANGGCPALTG